MHLNGEKSKLATLSNIVSKRKKIKIEKSIKTLENEKESLSEKQNYSFKVMLEQWMGSDYAVRHCEITKLLILAALIPLSTAEVEQSFSLMKLICTKLRKRLTNKSLTVLMRICKYEGKINYKEIKELWLNADKTKLKKKHIKSRLHWYYHCFVYTFLQKSFLKNSFIIFKLWIWLKIFYENRKSLTQYFWM